MPGHGRELRDTSGAEVTQLGVVCVEAVAQSTSFHKPSASDDQDRSNRRRKLYFMQ